VTQAPAAFIIESLGHIVQAEELVEPATAVKPAAHMLHTLLEVAPVVPL